MLIKLLKYDLLADYKKMGMLYITLLITSVMIKLLEVFFKDLDSTVVGKVVNITLGVVLGLCIVAMFVMMIIVSIYNFYKTIVRDEGYLTHTLPVQTWQLILSKLVTSYVWYIVSIGAFYLSIAILTGDINWMRVSEFMDEFQQGVEVGFTTGFNAGYNSVGSAAGETMAITDANSLIQPMINYVTWLFALFPLMIMSQVYFSFAIGNLFNKSKLGMSIVAFFVLYIAQQIIGFVTMMISAAASAGNVLTADISDAEVFGWMGSMYTSSLIVSIILTIGLYIGANVIFTKKLNLE